MYRLHGMFGPTVYAGTLAEVRKDAKRASSTAGRYRIVDEGNGLEVEAWDNGALVVGPTPIHWEA